MPSANYKVLGIGAPIIDLVLDVSDEYVQKLEGAKGGMMVVDHDHLQRIVNDSQASFSQSLGGSGANTIRGLAKLGYSCDFVGKIGRDPAGRMFSQAMAELNVKMPLPASLSPTSQVACLVTPDKERTMRTYLGASKDLTEKDLTPNLFQGVKLVHLEGYCIFNEPLILRAVALAKEAGALVSFDLGSFEVVEAYKDLIIRLLSRSIDIVFANQEEVRSLTQLDPIRGCSVLQDLCHVAVVLMGEKGCRIGSKGMQMHCPAQSVPNIVDTTGAGDLFASGFLHGYLQGHPLAVCAQYGSFLGAAVIRTQGVNISTTDWEELIIRLV